MSNVNINIREEDSSSGSSVDIRVIPGNGETEASSSDSKPSCNANERKRHCIIEILVETPLSRSYNQAKGVTVRLLQSNLDRVRIYTPKGIEQAKDTLNPNGDSIRVWSPENMIPWKFEIEIQEKEAVNPQRDQLLQGQDPHSKRPEVPERQVDT